MRRFLWVAPWAVLLMGAGPCEDDPAPMPNDGGSDVKADAPKAEAGTDSGNCLDKFEPVSTAANLFIGTWLVDNKNNNSVCPNGTVLKIVGWGEQGVPFADPEAGPCSSPSALLLVQPYDVKDCSTGAVCGSHDSGQVFYVHAGPKVYKGGGYNEDIWVVQGNEAHDLKVSILLYPDHPDQLTYGSVPYTRVQDILDGRCTDPAP